MSATVTSLSSRLESIVGASNVFADANALAAYAVDEIIPAAAVRPGTPDEVAEIVHFATSEKLALIPCGARTKLGIGGIPSRYDVAVDLSRLNRVLAYDPGDLTVSIEAGITIAELNNTLGQHKQFLPLFTPYMFQSTIGGTLASGVDSPLRQAYGTARDYLLGIEYIDGSGLRTKSGGRVVKNVAGYDIHKVHLGALGSLGIITRVNFRTFPSPVEGSHGFVASFANPEGAFELRHRIVDSPLTPLTLEVLSPELCRLFCTRNASSLGEPLASAEKWFPAGHSAVTAAFVGNPQVIARYERDLKCMAEECKASTTAVLGDADRPAVWGRLREALPLLRESSPAATLFRIPALPGKFCALIKSLCAAAEKAHVPSAYVVRSVGFVYFGLLPESSNSDSLSRLADVCGEIFKIAQQHEGHAVVMWCPTELKRRMNVWGTPRGDLELMKKVKQTFDPHGIFSPGRFAGGM